MTKTLGFILSASLAACTGQAEVRYSGDSRTPELVEMDSDPSVLVVANSDEPVFYSESSYWLFRDRQWYRSSSNRGGWSHVDQPPEHVRRIERPTAYVHYRHTASAPRTTLNQRPEPGPPRSPEPGRPDRPLRPEQTERLDRDPARDPVREPGQDPARPAVMPAEQIAPRPERPAPNVERTEPAVRPPAQAQPSRQVPVPSAEQRDRPERQIAPDPDREPIRTNDQRPAADRDDRRSEPRDDQPRPN